ncbi:hypothetical protein ACIQFZ_31000 [Streptomyces sp. NPDC093064]|uniref:hypothetical protein n=1 Tax=Streptomyces sp. NPDC093064 TaxID=3366020 RepID=UPI0038183405
MLGTVDRRDDRGDLTDDEWAAFAQRQHWYCHRRLHGEIGHIPPAEYETNYYRATTEPQVTVTT